MSEHQPICFIDTETDGLHHGRQAWEVAIIRRDPMPATGDARVWHESTYHVFVDLPSMRTSDNFALVKGGFWDRHPTGRELSGKTAIPSDVPLVSARAAARRIATLTHGAHLVGVNPTFDVEIFAAMLRSEGLTPQWDYHLEDLVAETVGYCRGVIAAARMNGLGDEVVASYADAIALPWRSDELAATRGVEPAADQDRHTALGDARWAARWYDAIATQQQTEVHSFPRYAGGAA